MAEKSYRDAIRDAMMEEMDRDPNVLIMGEDIGVYEGTFRITAGMLKKYGGKRVIDTPIAEAGMVGTAVGMAMLGLRPIVEMMTMNFAIVAADQILNHAAKVRYFSGGQVDVPMVIRGPQGAGVQLSAQHSQTFESFYGHFPGLAVVVPATPADAKGMLKTAIRDPEEIVTRHFGESLFAASHLFPAAERRLNPAHSANRESPHPPGEPAQIGPAFRWPHLRWRPSGRDDNGLSGVVQASGAVHGLSAHGVSRWSRRSVVAGARTGPGHRPASGCR